MGDIETFVGMGMTSVVERLPMVPLMAEGVWPSDLGSLRWVWGHRRGLRSESGVNLRAVVRCSVALTRGCHALEHPSPFHSPHAVVEVIFLEDKACASRKDGASLFICKGQCTLPAERSEEAAEIRLRLPKLRLPAVKITLVSLPKGKYQRSSCQPSRDLPKKCFGRKV